MTNGKGIKDAKASKSEKLAAALRENLKRRKMEAARQAEEKGKEDAEPENDG
jgi:hypothetical protein